MKKDLPFHIGHLVYKTMRWTTIILCFICATSLTVAANTSYGQSSLDKKISIAFDHVVLKEALDKIAAKAGTTFMYSGNVASSKVKLTVTATNKEVKEVLNDLLAPYPYSYIIQDDQVIIRYDDKKLKKKDTEIKVNAPTSSITITGQVIDENGKLIVGANIKIKGFDTGVTTDTDGTFTITVPNHTILVFSCVGFITQEVPVVHSETLNITLKAGTSTLDQVQIIGYGTTTRRLSTGDISSIKADVISEQPVTNPLQALEGRVPGLQITQGSGLPGSGFTVMIRGHNSIAASNNPLYIIDGVPFTSTPIERINGPSGGKVFGSPMNSINPADIESISVLKDADATAIYGSRGANGVILVTTKKGAPGKTKLDLNVNDGFGDVTREAQPLNTQQYLQLRRDAFANSGITPTAANAPDLLSWDQKTDNKLQDWFMGQDAHFIDANTSLSGGDQLTSFLISGAFHRETTVQTGDDSYKRGNLHFNINHTSLNKKFQIVFSGIYSSSYNRLQNSTNNLRFAAESVPNYPIYDSNDKYNWLANQTNFYAQSLSYLKSNTTNLNGNVNLSYNILPGLNLKGSLGYNKLENQQISASPIISQNPIYSPQSLAAFGTQFTDALLVEPQLTYSRLISKGKLDILIGSTIQKNNLNGVSNTEVNFPNDQLLESQAAGQSVYITSNTTAYNYLSFFSRASYNWDDRYIVSGTYRRDGSSRFAPGKQFGNFGSVGAAWLFSNEDVMKNNFPMLSYGKLRGSYGTTGSDGIGDYGYLSIYSFSAPYSNVQSIYPSQVANSNFQWEVNKKMELALELGFLKDRILLNSTWYRNRSSDQLVTYPLPTTTGFSGYVANLPAVVQNTGWEFELNTVNIKKDDLSWTSSFNLTIPKNKLVSFPTIASTAYANTLVVGQSLDIVQKYHFLGIDPATGLAQIEDVNKSGTITNRSSYNNQGGDLVIAGSTNPKWYAGFSNSLNYKGFQLNIFFQYVRQQGYNIYNNQTSTAQFGQLFNFWTYDLDYWKKPGDISTLPKPSTSNNTTLGQFANSDRTFTDASFLRLKTLAISYSLPSSFTSRLGFYKLRLYMQGENVLTITKFIGYDPELASNQVIFMPPLKVLTAGIQCTF